MAIKIIKNTLVDPIKNICDECGSEFEFNYNDIERTTDLTLFGSPMSRRYVVCPVCKHECSFKVIKLKNERSWETEQCNLSKKGENYNEN